MFFLGDIHGQWKTLRWLTTKRKNAKRPIELPDVPANWTAAFAIASGEQEVGMQYAVALGDLGLFYEKELENFETLPAGFKFIPGNHDNPSLCAKTKNCLSYTGYMKEIEMFWLGGGYSIDYSDRMKYLAETGVPIWWPEEQLTQQEMEEAFVKYADCKPKIMISHECPTAIKTSCLPNGDKLKICSRTEALLERMFAVHQPDFWIFGHYHRRTERRILATQFIGLNEFISGPIKECIFEIPGLQWPKPPVKKTRKPRGTKNE